MTIRGLILSTAVSLGLCGSGLAADDGSTLLSALDGDTPLVKDLMHLTDRIGGRATGSAANEKAVA